MLSTTNERKTSQPRRDTRTFRRIACIGLSTVAAMLSTVSTAGAAPELFTQFPEPPTPGEGANQLQSLDGIAFSPHNHHVYVTEARNRRISEFTAWGQFVQAIGWGVRDGAAEPQTCTSGTTCRKGLSGSGKGQFGEIPTKTEYKGPTGIVVDSSGALYVLDIANFRIQKLDPSGGFVWMVGGEVNKSKVALREQQEDNVEPVTVTEAEENRCTQASGDQCGIGVLGTGPGEWSIANMIGSNHDYVAIGPDGLLYVGDRNRIQVFGADGAFQRSIASPKVGNPGGLAADPVTGDLYFFSNQGSESPGATPTVYRLDSVTGEVLDEIEIDLGAKDSVQAIAVDPGGSLYVAHDPDGSTTQPGKYPQVLKYSAEGSFIESFDEVPPDEGLGEGLVASIAAIDVGVVGPGPDALNVYTSHIYGGGGPSTNLSRIKAYGPPPDPAVVGPPPKVAPSIEDQYAVAVGTTDATIRARINPHFWSDTTYSLQYGVGKCSEGGCDKEKPASPGALLTKTITAETITTPAIFLDGLEEATTYHYRVVAQGGGSDGQPTFGEEGTFTTRTPSPQPNRACANQALRNGPGAFLPDCRAYEMVSPVEKNGADVSVLFNVTGFRAGLDQSDPSGEKLSYSAYRAFGDAQAGAYTLQYVATRDAGSGWASHSIAPPRQGPTVLASALFDREYKALSTDLSSGWLFRETDPPLDPAAPAGYANVYRRNPDGSYDAAVTTAPPSTDPKAFVPELQGQGGGCTVFRANDRLTPNASSGSAYQLYQNCDGVLTLLSVLPSGGAAPAASAGTPLGGTDRTGAVNNAVSVDGSKVFWSNAASGTGRLFVRIGGSETIALTKGSAQFLTAAEDGSKAVYSVGDELYEFTVGLNEKEKGTLIAKGFSGLLGASEDASRLYLVSTQALDSDAEEGEPNLYLYEAGAPEPFTFITVLGDADAAQGEGAGPTPVSLTPFFHTAQVAADGQSVAFDSVAPLTGFDNRDTRTGKRNQEVFVYRAPTDALVCVSCDPSGVRPAGRESKAFGSGKNAYPVAATIPTAESQFHAPGVLSADGDQAFFNSYVPLALRDTNGRADVYQWEAVGAGDCEEGMIGYDVAWQGCVSLLSSGESPTDSELVDSGADGRDVFIKTASSLAGQDTGLLDIYDVRAGGGFPGPVSPAASCEGEACQSPPLPPDDPTPASAAFEGAGNAVDGAETKRPPRKKAAKKKPHKKKTHTKKHKRAHREQGGQR